MIRERFGVSAMWPELSRQALFDRVNINIRAGSTARPNKMRERDQWLQLLPIIQGSLEKVAAYRQQGAEQLAQSVADLLDETLRRFDETLSAEALLGDINRMDMGLSS